MYCIFVTITINKTVLKQQLYFISVFHEDNIAMADSGIDANSLSKKLDKYVTSIVQREGYINSEVKMKEISTNGGSYMGELYEIDIKGKTHQGFKETHIFAKRIIGTPVSLFSVQDVYKIELYAYSELSKIFQELQDDVNVPVSERFRMAGFFEESDKDMIIMENLAREGFKTYFRMDVINIDFTRLAVKELAKFHGLSFVLKSKRPDYFKKQIEPIQAPYRFDKVWDEFVKKMISVSLKYIEDNLKDKYEKVIAEKLNKYPKYMKEICEVRTLCHGDYRHNNILVKEIGGVPSQIVPIDYQIMHYGNPILDFFYLIYWGTDQEFRRIHLTSLKELYYDSLKTFLEYFNLDVDEVFPREEFEKQYKEKMDFGMMIGCIYLPFLFPVEDGTPDLTNAEDVSDLLPIRIDPKYRERFRGIVKDFIK